MPEQPREQPPARPEKGSHCSTCGAPYGPVSGWPRRCPACGDTAYRNPLPVAVALLPAEYADAAGTHAGLVVVTRAIAPARGTLALPGGFIDHHEDWRHAVVRELAEETGILASAADVRLADALSSPDGHLL
ncbi:NUDIX domain-containing protein, partial [Streptomyces boluensis]